MSYQKIQGPAPAKCVTCIRITNIVTGGLIVGMGAAGIIYMLIHQFLSARFYLIFAPIFTIFFGLALIFMQIKPKMIVEHFGFLKSLLGRGLFNIYLATQVTYYFGCANPDDILSWLASVILLIFGAFYICLYFFAGTNYGQELKKNLQEQQPPIGEAIKS